MRDQTEFYWDSCFGDAAAGAEEFRRPHLWFMWNGGNRTALPLNDTTLSNCARPPMFCESVAKIPKHLFQSSIFIVTSILP